MSRDRKVQRLAWFLGLVFILFGIAEVIRVAGPGGGGLALWFLSLCGGVALTLIGTFVVTQRPWLSFTWSPRLRGGEPCDEVGAYPADARLGAASPDFVPASRSRRLLLC